MSRAKKKIIVGLAIVFLISIWVGVSSNPLDGTAVFFVLTVLLWALAKTKRWI
jgi:hypothetical protein